MRDHGRQCGAARDSRREDRLSRCAGNRPINANSGSIIMNRMPAQPEQRRPCFFQLATNDLFLLAQRSGKETYRVYPERKVRSCVRTRITVREGPQSRTRQRPLSCVTSWRRDRRYQKSPISESAMTARAIPGKRSGQDRLPAPCSTGVPARRSVQHGYWIEFPAQCKGDMWSAQIPLKFAGLASQAFVNMGDEVGIVVSGALCCIATGLIQ